MSRTLFYILLLFSLIGSRFVYAQDSLIRHKPKHAIKISPVHLLGFYPTVQMAYEFAITDRINIQTDLGYVFNRNNSNDDYRNKRGVKLKLEGRYFLKSRFYNNEGIYFSIEPYFTAIDFDRLSVTQECFDANCQNTFLRYAQNKVIYREHGFSLKVGYMYSLGSRVWLDINYGGTLRDIKYEGAPRSTQQLFNFFEPNETDRIVIAPIIGVRLTYRIL